uniref:Uncharacterized protein n=1 Tax=Arundo donax TaxID=35708 RepID=A0A0A8Y5E6_ARUDO
MAAAAAPRTAPKGGAFPRTASPNINTSRHSPDQGTNTRPPAILKNRLLAAPAGREKGPGRSRRKRRESARIERCGTGRCRGRWGGTRWRRRR